MGRQFLAFEARRQRESWPEEKSRQWLAEMSGKLEECTRKAFLMALGGVMKAWGDKMIAVEGDLEGCRATHDGASRLILPFRPLILGGDDVTILCHASYAMPFVQAMTREFHRRSREAAAQADGQLLWPATNGELTMTQGFSTRRSHFRCTSPSRMPRAS